jgi:two-component system response regulator YesN
MWSRRLLWADLRLLPVDNGLSGSLPRRYDVRRVRGIRDVFRSLSRWVPWAPCFEFDAPEVCALDALAEIRQRYRALPLIVLANGDNAGLDDWAARHSMRACLVKPVSVWRLCSCLARINGGAAFASDVTENRKMAGARREPSAAMAAAPVSAALSVASAMSYVESNYVEQLRMSTVAKLCNLSPFQFSRSFKREHGLTFRDYMVKMRIQRAAQLMTESRMSVTDAAFQVGFNDCSYFARMFRRELGVCPSVYRADNLPGQLPLFPPSAPSARSRLQETTSRTATKS